MPRLIACVARREWALTWRRRADALGALLFFVIATSLFPIAVGADVRLLHAIAPGVLWVTALFSTMLAAPRLFAQDFDDGSLDLMLLAPQPLIAMVFAKIAVHWLTSGFALVLLTPVIALQYDLPARAVLLLTASLFVGTPVLCLIGAIGAALTVGVRGGGVLLAVLVLPLDIPVLIFGVGAADAVRGAAWSAANFSLLGAGLIAALVFCPVASAAALRDAAQ
ncbi:MULTISPECIES: heme exporter protein CcmB [unclassified Caballeronia]|uniref:heme exporter protein CcmB n=1 Tax=unclassified Caballeronia TaxID=2646786 RepID=UPI00285FD77E|nr:MULTISPECIES: heme exporter protein CcmB [unclassified Caballeronia]MDR5750283.1 heme exporter protein CcmB [Caballeronia sp. LZ024]MDR5844954.1 heme exporter protein CcmB [Caballeronia sp. LZ031]